MLILISWFKWAIWCHKIHHYRQIDHIELFGKLRERQCLDRFQQQTYLVAGKASTHRQIRYTQASTSFLDYNNQKEIIITYKKSGKLLYANSPNDTKNRCTDFI